MAILVVRTRKRKARSRVEMEMEMIQRCLLPWLFIEGAVWLGVEVFHIHQKIGTHLFLPKMSPLWCLFLNELNERNAAVSAKPRSFSFATQLHIRHRRLKCRHVCAFRVSFRRFGNSLGLGRAFAFGWVGGALTTSAWEWYPFLCGKARVLF